MLILKKSSIQFNSFASRALAQLTTAFDRELYEDFLDSWGTHIITASLVGGMIEERAKIKRCFVATSTDAFKRCIPFSDQGQIGSDCAYYASQTQVISKRRLGGNVEIENDNEWKRTLAVGPAMLQILEMMPWYGFVDDDVVKQNLRASIEYRLEHIDSCRAGAVRQVNAQLTPCFSGTFIHLIIPWIIRILR